MTTRVVPRILRPYSISVGTFLFNLGVTYARKTYKSLMRSKASD